MVSPKLQKRKKVLPMNEQGIRNHFSSVIIDSIKSLAGILIIGIFSVAEGFETEDFSDTGMLGSMGAFEALIAVAVVLALLLVVVIFNFLRWRKTYIIIDDENLVVNKNFLINKKSTTVRLSSIATVNFQQGIPERIFGTYRLQVDINSSVTADTTDFNLIFKKEVAEEIKARLTKHLDEDGDGITVHESIDENGEVVTATAGAKLIYKFSLVEVLRHCALSTSMMLMLFVVAIIVGTILLGTLFGGEDSDPIGALISMLVIVVPLVWSMLLPVFKYQNFKIEKVGNRAVISYGLFTHRQYNVPLDKTNAIVMHQPLFARIFGFAYGEILTVGMGEQEEEGTPIFCLMLKPEKLREIIAELRPDLLVNGVGESSPMKAYVSTCIPYLLFSVGFTAGAAYIGLWWLGIPVIAFMLFSAWLSVKTKALAVLSDKAVITSGVFHKRTLIVPNKKIQNISVKTGPISRRLGLAEGTVNVLAATIYSVHEIGYFTMDRFDTLFEKITYTE